MKITETSKALFIKYAKDAGNWSGTPLVGGNVDLSKEERGNLTQLKRAGLVTTFKDEGLIWLSFTVKGIDLAQSLGIDSLDWLRAEAELAEEREHANHLEDAQMVSRMEAK